MINRTFSPMTFNEIQKDFRFLFPLIQKYYGEIEFSIRNDYFNLYYKGNSLSKVRFVKKGSYEISIHKKFFEGSKAQSDDRFDFKQKGDHFQDTLTVSKLHPFFQKSHIDDLCSRIRVVNNGEEINFEQSIITDNIDNPDFFIIDRQVTDRDLQLKRMDLLALRRIENGTYRFVVLEVKLGKNKELTHAVAGQLSLYVDHIKKFFPDYAECFEKNYEQKIELGLLSFPNRTIKIDRNDVDGLVVVGGYSKIANKYISILKSAHTINIKQFDFKLSKSTLT
jgi:hypothetical protein